MLIQEHTKEWPTKVNFIDEIGVFVGYDTEQLCCEKVGFFFSDEYPNIENIQDYIYSDIPTVDDYMFCTDFFKNETYDIDNFNESTELAIFKLVHETKEPKYLILYNSHNGFYTHGFEATKLGTEWVSGSI